MKFSLAWVNEVLKSKLNVDTIVPQLINLGIEVESTAVVGDDHIIEIAVYPNRGDLLSIRGIARELAVVNDIALPEVAEYQAKVTSSKTIAVINNSEKSCPLYLCRIIENIDINKPTPEFIQAQLLAADIKPKNIIVDITNYVMLELGQPLHAFDANILDNKIILRNSRLNEQAALLDGATVKLAADILLITDKNHIHAIAGVMGGKASAVTDLTTTIVLESAYFAPRAVRFVTQKHMLNTDAGYRFSRGVDPNLVEVAIERASTLILEYAGGSAGAITKNIIAALLPKNNSILLNNSSMNKILGIAVADSKVSNILNKLQFTVTKQTDSWQVVTPTHRHDVALEEDLVEEIARVMGYDAIPSIMPNIACDFSAQPMRESLAKSVNNTLVAQGYTEVINYSFIDPKSIELLFPEDPIGLQLANPLSNDMSIMRSSLLSGLVNNLQYNLKRQQNRLRFFETGVIFTGSKEVNMLAGIVIGTLQQEQWGSKAQKIDFFAVKADVENLLKLHNMVSNVSFVASNHAALHNGKTAAIYIGKQCIGTIGVLHPRILSALELTTEVIYFELELDLLLQYKLPNITPVSRYPQVRRDLSFLIDVNIMFTEVRAVVAAAAGDLVQDIRIFDLFAGKNIAAGKKSMALAIILQHVERTLEDVEVNEVTASIVASLQDRFAIELRS